MGANGQSSSVQNSRLVRILGMVLMGSMLLKSSSALQNEGVFTIPKTPEKTPGNNRVWNKEKMKQYAFRRDVVRRAEERTKINREKRRTREGRDERTRRRHTHTIDSLLLEKAIPLEEYEAKLNVAGLSIIRKDAEPDFMRLSTKNKERRLEDEDEDADENEDADDYYDIDNNDLYDFSYYSLKYATCQPIQRFSESAITNGEYSALVTDNIIVLRLCPQQQCSSDSQYGCKSGYGEYAMSVSDYLRVMLQYRMDKQKNLCGFCQECDANNGRRHGRALDEEAGDGDQGDAADEDGGGDDYYAADDDDNANAQEAANGDDNAGDDNAYDEDDDCYVYQDLCQNYENWCVFDDENQEGDDDAALSYLDYINYFGCVQIEGEDGNQDDAYYVNPRCDPDSGNIKMGIFYDPYCSQYAGDHVDLDDYSGVYFADDIFEDFNSGECIKCADSDDPPYYSSNAYMCNKIYRMAAKCDTYLAYDIGGNGNANQNDDSDVVCSFIQSIRDGTYDDAGEIYVSSSQKRSNTEEKVTTGQIVGLIISSVVCAWLALYSCYLHHSITNLLLKSLSHGHLLSDSRSRRSRSRSRSRNRNRTSTRRVSDSDWDHDVRRGVYS